MTMARSLAVSVAFLAALSLQSAQSEDSPTLQRIRQTGTIVIGHRDVGIPFSYYDDQHRPVGYSIDICMRIADAIKTELGMKRVDVTFKELSAAMRIPLVANGTVDMECGSTSNNASRAQQVTFSDTIFVASVRFVTKKKFNLISLENLRGMKMAAVSGTDTIRQFSTINSQKRIGMIIEPAKDHRAAFEMLETDQVEAYGAIDTSAYSMVARSKSPDSYFISAPLSVEPFAIVLRKDDLVLKHIADEVIVKLFQSGEMNRLYDKWFQSPLPGFGFNLKLPLSQALKSVMLHPTDSSNPNDYRE